MAMLLARRGDDFAKEIGGLLRRADELEARRGRRIEARKREIVRDFGVESEQQRAEERIEHADRARAGCEG